MTLLGDTAVTNVDRREVLRREVIGMLAELSGLSDAELPAEASFLNLGFDSLFLTQASAAMKSRFGVPITFRQLLETTPSIEALAEYLDAELEPDRFRPQPDEPVVVAEVPFSDPSTVADGAVGGGALAGLVRQQLDLLAEQMRALSQASGIHVEPPAFTATPGSRQNAREARGPAGAPVASEPRGKRMGPWRPIAKDPYAPDSPAALAAIDWLVAEYTARTPRSKAWTAEHRPHLADPRATLNFNRRWKELVYPLVSERSLGSRLWDIDGNEYLDAQSGFGSVFFGHNPQAIRDALTRQLENGVQIGPQSALAGDVARRICAVTGNERATFCNTGSEAVLAAVRVARTVTGKRRIAMFAGDYHGIFDEVIARRVGDMDRMKTVPVAPGIPPSAVEQIVILDYGDPDCFRLLDDLADDLAAVLVEPVQSRRPDFQPREFLHRLRDWTRAHSVACIFDEVITGFRVHPRGAQGLFGIEADLCAYGKIIGGGMPVGVLAGRREYMDALDGGAWQYGDDSVPEVGITYFAGTFVRHPLVLAAAEASIGIIERGGTQLYDDLHARSERLVASINARLVALGSPLQVQHCRSMMYVDFLVDSPANGLFFAHLRLHGVHVMETGTMFLTLAHDDDDVTALIEAFGRSAAWMLENELHPVFERDAPLATMTSAQREIWFAVQKSDDASRAYNMSMTVDFDGELDVDALETAMIGVVNRHESLRMTVSSEGELRIGAPVSGVALRVHDLTRMAEAERDEAIERIATADALELFDLVAGPPIRFTLLRLDDARARLLATLHHIAGDGWAFGLLMRQLGQLYGKETVNAADSMQLSEYRAWLQDDEQRARHRVDERYWLGVHADPAPPLELPLDATRPARRSFAAGNAILEAAPSVVSRLDTVSRAAGVTPYVFLLSVFQALVHRLSGQDDFNVAIPVAGQQHVDNPSLVCHCVNLMCLRNRVSVDQPFSALLGATRTRLFDAFDHPMYQYGELVTALGLGNDPARNPLFSVMFNVDFVDTDIRFAGLDIELGKNPKRFDVSELFLDIGVSGERLRLDCSFASDLFAEATVERWLSLYLELLDAFLADREQRIDAVDCLPAVDLELLDAANRTAMEYPRDSTVAALVAASAARVGESVAVVGPDDAALSYAGLEAASNRLAHHLIERGAGPGDRVGVYLERSVEMVVALVAVMKSGAAYVPLDPLFPPERLAYMAQDAALKTVITERALLGTVPGAAAEPAESAEPAERAERAEPVVLDAPGAPWRACSDAALDRSRAEATAYVIYTSGSTGQPKGVSVGHRALVNFLCSMGERPGLSEQDRLLAVTTLSFDIAGLELYLPLVRGARVVVASREEAMDPGRLAARLSSCGATLMQATPASWKLLVEHGWTGDGALKVLCGGEPLSRDLADRLVERCAEVWNLYGPTETTIWSTLGRVSGSGPITVGTPIGNTEVYVLDAAMNVQPVGVPGELYIGGEGVAEGYLERAQLTAERFVADPFGRREGGRLYRTGDRARWRADGELEVLGRLDDQVKLRGYRIEPGEIRARLVEQGSVADAVVVVREDEPGEARLVAYLVAAGGAQDELDLEGLRAALKETLPEYMVPGAWVELERLPLTPNGKVDRRGLPAPELGRLSDRAYEAPTTETERVLAQIWSTVLGVERVGREDDFFALGGHSLKAVQVVSRLRGALSIDTPLRWIFEHATLRALAREIDGLGSVDAAATPRDLGDGLVEIEL